MAQIQNKMVRLSVNDTVRINKGPRTGRVALVIFVAKIEGIQACEVSFHAVSIKDKFYFASSLDYLDS